MILPIFRVGDRVLDVAAGTGDQTIMVAQRVGSNGYVLATDISANMLNLAADAAREAGFTNVETRVMDAEKSDLEVDSFNAAVCRSSLMNFPQSSQSVDRCVPSAKALREIRGDSVLDSGEKSLSWASTVNRSPPGKNAFASTGTAWDVRALGPGVLEDCYKKAGFRRCGCPSGSYATVFPFHRRSRT